jgi:hypothetical protein
MNQNDRYDVFIAFKTELADKRPARWLCTVREKPVSRQRQ